MAGRKITPNAAMRQLMDENPEIQAQYELLSNEARKLINIWAASSPNEKEEYRRLLLKIRGDRKKDKEII